MYPFHLPEETPVSAQTPGASGPTGEQWELRHGGQSAVVVELGGALRHYEADGRPLLDGFAADAPVTAGRGQLLVPWPNRVGGGRYRFDGTDLQLPLSEPEHHNAIHGLLRWTPWRLLDRSGDALRAGTTLHPQPGYPFQLEVTADYRLTDEGLEVLVRATNTGTARAPYGVGQHPYLTVGTGPVDAALLTVPARFRLRTDDAGLPVGEEPVEGTEYDFRTPAPSARSTWTPPSPDSTATGTAGPWSGWPTPRGGTVRTYGSARAPGACRSTPVTPWRSPSGAAGWPWRPCPARRTPSARAPI